MVKKSAWRCQYLITDNQLIGITIQAINKLQAFEGDDLEGENSEIVFEVLDQCLQLLTEFIINFPSSSRDQKAKQSLKKMQDTILRSVDYDPDELAFGDEDMGDEGEG